MGDADNVFMVPDGKLEFFADEIFKYIRSSRKIDGREAFQKDNDIRQLVIPIGQAVDVVDAYRRFGFRKILNEACVKFKNCMEKMWWYIGAVSSEFFSETYSVIKSLLEMSAFLVEVIYFLEEKGCTELVCRVPQLWKEVFMRSCKERFLKKEGWKLLKEDGMFYADVCLPPRAVGKDEFDIASSDEILAPAIIPPFLSLLASKRPELMEDLYEPSNALTCNTETMSSLNTVEEQNETGCEEIPELSTNTKLSSYPPACPESLKHVYEASNALSCNADAMSSVNTIEARKEAAGRNIYNCTKEFFKAVIEDERKKNEGNPANRENILNEILLRFLREFSVKYEVEKRTNLDMFLQEMCSKLEEYIKLNNNSEEVVKLKPFRPCEEFKRYRENQMDYYRNRHINKKRFLEASRSELIGPCTVFEDEIPYEMQFKDLPPFISEIGPNLLISNEDNIVQPEEEVLRLPPFCPHEAFTRSKEAQMEYYRNRQIDDEHVMDAIRSQMDPISRFWEEKQYDVALRDLLPVGPKLIPEPPSSDHEHCTRVSHDELQSVEKKNYEETLGRLATELSVKIQSHFKVSASSKQKE